MRMGGKFLYGHKFILHLQTHAHCLLNTEELLKCMGLCSYSENQVLNYLLSFDDSIQHCRIWAKNMYSFTVGHNVFWAWVFLVLFE